MGLLETIHEAEIDLFRSLNLAGTNEPLDIIMLVFTFLGMSYIIVLVSVPLWLQGKKDSAFDAIILVIIATLIAEVLKLLVDRPRPDVELESVKTIVSASGSSFPSGHATRAFAVATLVLLVEPRRYGVLALAVASVIAISRVYLGVHWPTDILAGAVLGSLTAVAFIELAKRSSDYQDIRKKVVGAIERTGS